MFKTCIFEHFIRDAEKIALPLWRGVEKSPTPSDVNYGTSLLYYKSLGINWTSPGDHILTSVTKNGLKIHIFNAFYAYNMSKWPQENALLLKFSLMGCCSMKYCTIIGFLPDFRKCTLKIWSFFVIAQANSAQIFALVGNFWQDSKLKCILNRSTGTNKTIKNKN